MSERTTEEAFCRHLRVLAKHGQQANPAYNRAQVLLAQSVDAHLHPKTGAESIPMRQLVDFAVGIFAGALAQMGFSLTDIMNATPEFAADVRTIVYDTTPQSTQA
ncbi:MAG TPA: hypothetical protein VLG40_01165 [Candidatus Saccharimonas sp.]|nr:hypothetical protein [Candidatus Saccharimonas sp.]